MKKILLTLFIAAALPFAVLAQAPQKFNYQAVARNAAGDVMSSQTINVKISVNDGSSSGTTVYQETHSVTTNQFGLFTAAIGTGTVTSGTFAGINWGSGAKYLKVEADFGSGYTDMGTSQLLSVPYALFAASAPGSGDDWGTQTAVTNSTLSGNGTSGNPLGIAAQGAVNGQVMQWNGSTWAPATITGGVGDNWGTQSVIANSPLSGTGVSGNPLKLQDGTANGQVLRWNGSAWVAQTVSDNDQQTLTYSSGNLSISNGNTVTLPTGSTYTAGTGISINGGNVISNTGDNDNNATNEIQSLSLSTNVLSISGGNSVTLPGGATYTAGSGININGSNVISATDNSATNEIQTLSISGSDVTLSNGGGNTVTLPSGGGGFTLPYANVVNSPSILFDIEQSGSGTSGNAGYFTNSSLTNTQDGLAGQTYGVGSGVFGYNNNGNIANTVWGVYGAYNGASYGTGVTGLGWGGITNPTLEDIGVYGSSNNVGVYGQSNGLNGVLGKSVATSGVGVYGIYEGFSDANAGVYGYNDYGAGLQVIGVEGTYNTTSYGVGVLGVGYQGDVPLTSMDYGVYGSATYGVWGYGTTAAIYAEGNQIATGTKSASVPTSKGNQLVYCMESPEIWFEDFGQGSLVNGELTVTLDPMFLETVHIDASHPMIVTVTPQGDCKGLYVVPGTTSFTVKELNGGNSNVTFSYRISCKREYYQDHRFGSDVTWKGGDPRKKAHYMTPRPIDYNEAIKLVPIDKSQTITRYEPKFKSSISGMKLGTSNTKITTAKPHATLFRSK